MPSAQRPVFTPESLSRFYPTTRVVTAIPNNPPPDYPISVLGKIKYALRRKAVRAAAAERTPQTPQTTYHTNERGQIIETSAVWISWDDRETATRTQDLSGGRRRFGQL
ncbi:hypothetical protein BN1723_000356 [Verticillium longisporum]|uniref:Uncharacterized protein n=1 Tax=Verticillium longisporum TaxID=100787 RepID=A0A0G4LER9_VERLO|nr:hypothetical protein BN1723_000356 [Verticillium longisporum]